MPTVVQITVNTISENTNVKVVEIVGELDESNLSELESVVNPLIQDQNNRFLILKMNGLNFMSSKIIGFLASAYNKLNSDDRQIIFAGCNKTIDDILSIVGLNQMIPCYGSVGEALSAMTNLPSP
jgi:anti-anti-sigma factor